MTIDTLDELEALLKLCHRQGVHEVTVDGLTVRLTPVDPNAAKGTDGETGFIDPRTGLPMSEEDLLMWSAGS